MHLSARQFAKISARLNDGAGGGVASVEDKRRSARVSTADRASIVPYVCGAAGSPTGIEVRDFSPRGIRFLHSARLAAGSQFVLRLPQQTGDPVQILCTVAHCRVTAQGPVSIGAEFTCVIRKGASPTQPPAGAAAERERIRRSILD
jgi:hypothetical protein